MSGSTFQADAVNLDNVHSIAAELIESSLEDGGTEKEPNRSIRHEVKERRRAVVRHARELTLG
jgi:hypothetical protein